jgi:hypothetical protein
MKKALFILTLLTFGVVSSCSQLIKPPLPFADFESAVLFIENLDSTGVHVLVSTETGTFELIGYAAPKYRSLFTLPSIGLGDQDSLEVVVIQEVTGESRTFGKVERIPNQPNVLFYSVQPGLPLRDEQSEPKKPKTSA